MVNNTWHGLCNGNLPQTPVILDASVATTVREPRSRAHAGVTGALRPIAGGAFDAAAMQVTTKQLRAVPGVHGWSPPG